MTGTASQRARVFFALWPDPAIQDTLAALAATAQSECGGRATARDKIHLTLFFVGGIERARLAELQTLASGLAGAAFELGIDVLGYWRHNRIVWAGSNTCPHALLSLVTSLSAALLHVGITAEERPYAPHITLLRDARKRPSSTRLAACAWRVRDFALVESVATRSGSRYEVIERWPLGTQSAAL